MPPFKLISLGHILPLAAHGRLENGFTIGLGSIDFRRCLTSISQYIYHLFFFSVYMNSDEAVLNGFLAK